MDKIAPLLLLIFLAGCSKNNESPPLSLSLNQSDLSLNVGDTYQLDVTLSRPDYSVYVSWDSTNPLVASVSQSGRVTAHKEGTAVIHVNSGDLYAECLVTATAIYIEEIIPDQKEVSILIGDKVRVGYTINPEFPTYSKIQWESTDVSIASVSDGVITGINAGEATIRIYDTYSQKSAHIKVNVSPILVTGIEILKTDINVEDGEIFTLDYTILPSNATNKSVSYQISNDCIEINDKGEFIARKTGTSTIMVTTEDGGFSDLCNVIITPYKGGLYFEKSRYIMLIGSQLEVKAIPTINWYDEKVHEIEYSSSNPDIVSIVQTGHPNPRLLANSLGVSIITAKIKGTDISASFQITALPFKDCVSVRARGRNMASNSSYVSTTFHSRITINTDNIVNYFSATLIDDGRVMRQVKSVQWDGYVLFDPIIHNGVIVTDSFMNYLGAWKVIYQFEDVFSGNIYTVEEFINSKVWSSNM